MQIAVADIGGTHARFAPALLDPALLDSALLDSALLDPALLDPARFANSGAVELSDPVVLKTDDYPDLTSAWHAFLAQRPGFAPQGAALALAGPVGDAQFKLTNNSWAFDPATVPAALGVERITMVNDFAAVAHGVAGANAGLEHLAGPAQTLPRSGTVSVIGPGTGLGVAHIRFDSERLGPHALVQATEGSHNDFAPVNAVDDAVLAALRCKYERVSTERVVSGGGIAHIYAAMAALEGRHEEAERDALSIWQAGLTPPAPDPAPDSANRGEHAGDPLAERAVAHFVETLGRVAGDFALAHGASAMVIAGGLGLRLQHHLRADAFHQAFLNKGRYRAMMERMPIFLTLHPQPGLLGAAHAFLNQHSGR